MKNKSNTSWWGKVTSTGTISVDKDDMLQYTTVKDLRNVYKYGFIIVNANYTAETGCDVIRSGNADAVSFGRAWMSNPDLVEKFKTGGSDTLEKNPHPDMWFKVSPKTRSDPSWGYTDTDSIKNSNEDDEMPVSDTITVLRTYTSGQDAHKYNQYSSTASKNFSPINFNNKNNLPESSYGKPSSTTMAEGKSGAISSFSEKSYTST